MILRSFVELKRWGPRITVGNLFIYFVLFHFIYTLPNLHKASSLQKREKASWPGTSLISASPCPASSFRETGFSDSVWGSTDPVHRGLWVLGTLFNLPGTSLSLHLSLLLWCLMWVLPSLAAPSAAPQAELGYTACLNARWVEQPRAVASWDHHGALRQQQLSASSLIWHSGKPCSPVLLEARAVGMFSLAVVPCNLTGKCYP